MDFALQYGFRLGTLEVYPLRGEIVGPNGTVHLQPKAMEVLVVLPSDPWMWSKGRSYSAGCGVSRAARTATPTTI